MSFLIRIKTRAMLHARRRVSGLLDGQYASVQAGRSLDFSDLRSYVPGDDVADIDWKASARHGDLLVKRYVADRKHTVLLVVDTGHELAATASWPGSDPSRPDGDLKRDVAITAAGLIGWVATRHGDYVGVVCHTDDGPTVRRPTTRELELERMLELIHNASQPTSPAQQTGVLLDYAATVVRRRTMMVLILGDVTPDAAFEGRVRRLMAQHEVLVITVADVDPTLPGRAGVAVRELGSDRRFPRFAARSHELARDLAEADAERAEARTALLARLGVAHVHLATVERAVADVLGVMERSRRAR